MPLVSENGWRQHPLLSPAAVTRLRSPFDLRDAERARVAAAALIVADIVFSVGSVVTEIESSAA